MENINELRENIIAELQNEANVGLLNDIQSLILSNRADSDNSFAWELSKEFNDAIGEAEQDIISGNVYTHQEVMAYVKKTYINGDNLVK